MDLWMKFLWGLAILYSLTSTPLTAQEVMWVPADGRVQLADGTPICAMVLANGQYMFSCDGTGAFDLDVPLDGNRKITIFSFADGFAPFKATIGPGRFPLTVQMQTAVPGSPRIEDPLPPLGCAGDNRARIAGTVSSDSFGPLCAMVLANGQYMFSCGDSLGEYDLTVPVAENGEITLFKFADGFQPYREIILLPDFVANCQASSFNGVYSGVATPSTTYGGNGIQCGSAQIEFTIDGSEMFGEAFDTWGRRYSLDGTIDSAGNIGFVLAFAFGNTATATGAVNQASASGSWEDVYGCKGNWRAQKQ